jgi:hypothetical protein
MNRLTKFFALCLLVLSCLTNCGDKEIKAPANAPAQAKISGTTVSFNTNKVTDTGQGLEIKLNDGAGKTLTFFLSDDATGTYAVTNIGEKTAKRVIVQFADNSNLYFGISGTLTLSSKDGNVAGTFSLALKNTTGQTVEIGAGTFGEMNIGEMAGGCKLVESNILGEYSTYFEYNSDGKIVRLALEETEDGSAEFIFMYNTSGKIIEVITIETEGEDDYISSFEVVRDNNGRVSKLTLEDDGDITETHQFTYNNSGQITMLQVGSTDISESMSVTYTPQGNVHTITQEGLGTTTYTNYDSKKNPFKTVFEDDALIMVFVEFLGYWSTNNPTAYTAFDIDSNIQYEYNSADYPKKITESIFGESFTINLTYDNCE